MFDGTVALSCMPLVLESALQYSWKQKWEERKSQVVTFCRLLSSFGPTQLIISSSSCLDARKLLNQKKGSIMEGTLLQGALPEGTSTPPSTRLSEKLFALHLAHIDRILQSVPSPGAGH
ncbi:hypothetical protein L2E82_25723 [Cichorium intybus]|uniref:Uncharacterized protein n=1 Tax=Cichorium intybus TaxID=13427 RepID=A0ACB9E507_CICIN|nr:hypothetical protein L2E82_25723 [Cichorium intybus]